MQMAVTSRICESLHGICLSYHQFICYFSLFMLGFGIQESFPAIMICESFQVEMKPAVIFRSQVEHLLGSSRLALVRVLV